MSEAVARIDGAARGNPGPAGAGVVLEIKGGAREVHTAFLGKATNNVAEYSALILALQAAKKSCVEKLTVYSDSELIVRQVCGAYKVKAPELQKLFLRAKMLIEGFVFFEIKLT